jgi:hypothetical protein
MLLRSTQYLTRREVQRFTSSSLLARKTYSTASRIPFATPTRAIASSRAPQSWHQISQHRGAKKTATLTLEDLPQGAMESNALPPQDDTEPEYPPLLQQVRNNMLKFSHCVVVTRVGGFYEVCVLLSRWMLADWTSSILNTPTSLLHFLI